jgi:hypothetical protein
VTGKRIVIGWRPEHDLSLKNLISNGYTFAKAAGFLNEKYGTNRTRDACIGRAHRLALPNGLVRQKPPPMSPRERQQLHTKRRKEKRWAANPSLAERARRIEEKKKHRAAMVVRGIAKTSPGYRNHLPRIGNVTKNELRSMLTTAVQNTAAMGDIT